MRRSVSGGAGAWEHERTLWKSQSSDCCFVQESVRAPKWMLRWSSCQARVGRGKGWSRNSELHYKIPEWHNKRAYWSPYIFSKAATKYVSLKLIFIAGLQINFVFHVCLCNRLFLMNIKGWGPPSARCFLSHVLESCSQGCETKREMWTRMAGDRATIRGEPPDELTGSHGSAFLRMLLPLGLKILFYKEIGLQTPEPNSWPGLKKHNLEK